MFIFLEVLQGARTRRQKPGLPLTQFSLNKSPCPNWFAQYCKTVKQSNNCLCLYHQSSHWCPLTILAFATVWIKYSFFYLNSKHYRNSVLEILTLVPIPWKNITVFVFPSDWSRRFFSLRMQRVHTHARLHSSTIPAYYSTRLVNKSLVKILDAENRSRFCKWFSLSRPWTYWISPVSIETNERDRVPIWGHVVLMPGQPSKPACGALGVHPCRLSPPCCCSAYGSAPRGIRTRLATKTTPRRPGARKWSALASSCRAPTIILSRLAKCSQPSTWPNWLWNRTKACWLTTASLCSTGTRHAAIC